MEACSYPVTTHVKILNYNGGLRTRGIFHEKKKQVPGNTVTVGLKNDPSEKSDA